MKKIILFSFLSLFFWNLPAQAAPKENDGAAPKNNIKLNLMALTATNISLQYERALGFKTSVALGVGFMPAHRLPYTRYVKDQFLEYGTASQQAKDATNDFLDEARISGFSVTPEFRYYFGKRPQSGFYIAPFLRYASYSLDWDYVFKDEDKGTLYPTTLNGTLSLLGGGVMVGAQWYYKKISIDWWILGGSYNKTTLTLDAKVNLSNMDAEDRAELNDQIRDVTVKGKYFDATIKDSGVNGKGSVGLPALRLGLCIGFRF